MDPTTAAIVSAVASVLAALAAVVSAVVAGWAVHEQRQAAKPRVQVDIKTAFVAGPQGVGPVHLAIDVKNRGLVPVMIDGVGFELLDSRTMPSIHGRNIEGIRVLPKRLEAGEALSIVADVGEVATTHRSEGGIRCAYATTAAGDRFRSEPVPSNWLAGW